MMLSHTKPLKLGFSRATSLKLLIRFFGVISSRQIHPARVAQLVEHQLPKLRVASSNLVSRSLINSHLASLLSGCFAFKLHDELHKPFASVGQVCFPLYGMTAKAPRSSIEGAGPFLLERVLSARKMRLPI